MSGTAVKGESDAGARLWRFHLPAYRARLPWVGGDLQTIRNLLVGRPPGLSRWPAERVVIAAPNGDRLLGLMQVPGHSRRPLVILLHGLTGCEESFYMKASAAAFLKAGWPVLRMNLRGAGPSGPFCRETYHAGPSEDLRMILAFLAGLNAEKLRQGVLLMGFSLGGNLLLKFLGEGDFPAPVLGGIAVSAPIELRAAQERLMEPRNRPYQSFLLAQMRRELALGAAALTEAQRLAVKRCRNVLEFDDLITAPRNGFADASDYYLRASAAAWLRSIAVPTLVLQAADDPWIPVTSYRQIGWSANPYLRLELADSGGHVGFHGRGSRMPWHDRCALAFAAAFSPP